MRLLACFVCCSLVGCVAEPLADSDEVAESTHAIMNGNACRLGESPATVAVLSDGIVDFKSMGGKRELRTVTCTGTLIAPDVVLTAAHCLDMSLQTMGFGTVLKEGYAITFQDDLVELAAQETSDFPPDAIAARGWVAHKGFDINKFDRVSGPGEYHDVALLFLERKVTGIRPELLVTLDEAEQLAKGSSLAIAGWGMTRLPRNQYEAPPRGSVGQKICATSFVNELGPTEMQVGSAGTSPRKCHGDSGGPSYFIVNSPHDVKRRVVGITSHAYDERDCAVGGVDTRVDAYLDWIDEQLETACRTGKRVWCNVSGIIPPDFYDVSSGGKTTQGDSGSGGDAMQEGGCATGKAGLWALAVLFVHRRKFWQPSGRRTRL